jgi:riboflavin kinase/FMN adenylyltransferase
MKIFTQMTNLRKQFSNIAVALGTFDGVHVGHQKIIQRVVQLAQEIDGTSVVLTFNNHPLSIIDPKRCPLQIVTAEDKTDLIQSLGVDVLLTIPFTPQFLKLSPSEFITILLDNLKPVNIVIGPNYSFGYKSTGTPEVLQQAGMKYGFKVEVHQAVYVDHSVVSSTAIRQMIATGDVKTATRFLGRPLRIRGKVITGEKRGRILGYPTANLAITEGLAVPEDGVYAVHIYIESTRYKGVANVGTNPTFDNINRRIEVYVLDFQGDLYGEFVAVDFLERIRGEIRFLSVEELKTQIFHDIQTVRDIIN